MKVKLQEVVEAMPGMKKLMGIDLAARFAFRIGRIGKALGVHSQHFDEVRNKLVLKMAGDTKPDANNQIHVLPANMPEYIKELESLLQEDVEVLCERVDLSMLSDLKVAAVDMVALESFFKFYEEEPEDKKDGNKSKVNQ